MYPKKIHTDMHTHMHTIQPSAYPIWIVHIGYAHCYIHLYLPVSRVAMLYILCIFVRMSDIFIPHTSRYIQICTLRGVHIYMYLTVFPYRIHAHMHSFPSAYLHVSVCILILNTFRYAFRFLNTCTYALIPPVHICMYLSVF